MAKRYLKGLKRAGRAFCIFNTHHTAIAPVYIMDGNIYVKPRLEANKGQTINGVNNLVLCKPLQIGIVSGYIEA